MFLKRLFVDASLTAGCSSNRARGVHGRYVSVSGAFCFRSLTLSLTPPSSALVCCLVPCAFIVSSTFSSSIVSFAILILAARPDLLCRLDQLRLGVSLAHSSSTPDHLCSISHPSLSDLVTMASTEGIPTTPGSALRHTQATSQSSQPIATAAAPPSFPFQTSLPQQQPTSTPPPLLDSHIPERSPPSSVRPPSRSRVSIGMPERVRVSLSNEGLLHMAAKGAQKSYTSVPGSVRTRKTKTVNGGGEVATSYTREDGVASMFSQLDQMSLRVKENVADNSFQFGADGEYFDDPEELGPSAPPTRSKTSWIKPRVETKLPKQDPVDRGRYYRAMQKEFKVPGQNQRHKLRWEVREKLKADKEEPYVRPRTAPGVNRYVVPTDKKRMPLRWAVREHLNNAR